MFNQQSRIASFGMTYNARTGNYDTSPETDARAASSSVVLRRYMNNIINTRTGRKLYNTYQDARRSGDPEKIADAYAAFYNHRFSRNAYMGLGTKG